MSTVPPVGLGRHALDELLDVANAAADAAARIHRGAGLDDLGIGTKSSETDLVTIVDARSEEAIRRVIALSYPEHAVLGEEAGQDVEASYRWIVDPLDGTVNFAHGFPCYCVSIALEAHGRLLVGVVLDTARGERFTAIAGGGAFVDGRRLRVSRTTQMRRAMLATGFAYGGELIPRNAAIFSRMLTETRAIRRAGSAALDMCNVAAGRFDAYWELGVQTWDVAAGVLIVQEAGGTVTAGDGSPYRWGDEAIVVSNGALHGRLLHLLDLAQARA